MGDIRKILRATLATIAILSVPATAGAACVAQSGPGTAVLVELYTSEGCSSCPPADELLLTLRQAMPATQVVPLALHVGYWDYIGWKDRFAKAAFEDRHLRLARANNQGTVYTPQFFVAGASLNPRRSNLADVARQLHSAPPGAAISLEARIARDNVLGVDVEARLADKSAPAALYIGLTEDGLSSAVVRGENAGATLRHEHVLRDLVGPIRLDGEVTRIRQHLKIAREWKREHLEVIAFVQDERSGAILQALGAARCATH